MRVNAELAAAVARVETAADRYLAAVAAVRANGLGKGKAAALAYTRVEQDRAELVSAGAAYDVLADAAGLSGGARMRWRDVYLESV